MMKYGNQSKGMRWQVSWGKHFPATFRGGHKTKTDKDVAIENTLPLVSVRDPYQWLQSMCRHTYAANWPHTEKHCPNIVPNSEDMIQFPQLRREDTVPVRVRYAKDVVTSHRSLPDFYNDWYRLYVNATFPRIIVRFEDLLFYAEEVVGTLCKCGGGVLRDDFGIAPRFRHVSASAKLGTSAHGNHKTDLVAALIKYGNDDHRSDKMTKEDLKAAAEMFDPEIMRLFGYTHP
jgi:hypothetical protein